MNVWVYGSSGLIVEAVAVMLRGFQFRVATTSQLPADADVALWVHEATPRDNPPPAPLPTLVLIDADGDVLIGLLARGYRGYVSPNAQPTTLRDALRAVAAGAIWAPREMLAHAFSSLVNVADAHSVPTPREREVLMLISMALSNRAIAERLGITERTVKAHVSSLLTKYQVRSRVELAVSAGNARERNQRQSRGRTA